ncbi:MAG TPA: cob(I)yrinic acid a,c-diamide adenosyltransferase [Novimethylophilus sp.]|jgi:cob(I)alamin adenosyltransferase|uniref:cob(I)yrinic acid a,c-diamide adenosyltransferase n=1 Tax=Novimethylophilus sp. TaxID=2137426 RepID=UPI002F3EDB4F
MGNRLTKIYTRTGDDGSTGLGDGSRAGKESPRVAAMGEVDELNAGIGVLAAEALPQPLHALLTRIQHDLFDLGGELCIPGHKMLDESRITWLEAQLDDLNGTLPPLKEFILPGGSRPAALCHLARTVCRRAERSVVHLARGEEVAPAVRQYLNRLSDFLFVLARILNRELGHADVLWKRS